MPCYRLILEYDGTDFRGWQSQRAEDRTVQAHLEAALGHVCGQDSVPVVAAGRTDSGVHAEGQLVSVEFPRDFEPKELLRALNGLLDPDCAVVDVARAPAGWNARRQARCKLYRYRIWNGAARSPLRRQRSAWVGGELDVAEMARAARAFEGEHDFASLQAAGSSVRTTTRRLLRCQLEGQAGGELSLSVEGTGFLRHMVRNLVGTLIEVGRGKRPADSIPTLLAARDRSAAGPTALAAGLCLVRVDFDEAGV